MEKQTVGKTTVYRCFIERLLMDRAIDLARQATQTCNWSIALGYLQLGLQQAAIPMAAAPPQAQQEFLDLALQVLAEGDFKARWDVAKLLPQCGKAAIAPLIEIARDEEADLEERWFAGRLLGQFDAPEAVTALVELLQETDDADLAAIAADALAAVGPSAIAPLATLLENPATCALAATALAQISSTATIEPLLGVIDSPEAAVRATAIAALSNFHDPRVPPMLLAALKDHAAPVRKAAAIGLGLRAAAADELQLLRHLQPLLHDLNPEVCQQAALAIGRLRSDAAANLLAAELQDELTPLPQKVILARALAWIESPTALAGLERSLLQAPDPIALEIVRAIGRISSAPLRAKAAEILLALFKARATTLDVSLAQALAHAWSLLGQPIAREALQQLERNPAAGVCLHARMALQKLATHRESE